MQPFVPEWSNHRATASGGEPFDAPGVAGAADVAQPVVQAVLAVLPELDPGWLQRVAAPALGQRHLIRILLRQLEHAALEDFSRSNHLALRRCQRRDLCATRPAGEIREGCRVSDLSHRTVDTDLVPRDRPVEDERRTPVM